MDRAGVVMKHFRQLAASATAVFVLAAAALHANAAAVYSVIDGFAFDIRDGGAVIHEYRGSSHAPSIPESLLDAPVTRIDGSAFFGQESLTAVSFENAVNLQTIGSNAFYNCKALTSVSLPDQVTEVAFGAFQGCSALTDVELSGSMTAIAAQTFDGCESLANVTVPRSVQRIGAYAFGGCTALTTVWIPDSVTEISATAFEGDANVLLYCQQGSCAEAYAVEHELPYVLAGDVNGDRTVNINDVTAIQCYLAEIDSLSDEALLAADTDGDGELAIADASRLQMYLAEYDVKLGRQL